VPVSATRLRVGILFLAVAAASCGIGPLSKERLPEPSRRQARAAAYEICARAADRYGIQRMSRYLGAASDGPRPVARAFVREVARASDGWEPYRAAGFRGCLAGLRASAP
jgi:hypothetical protein